MSIYKYDLPDGRVRVEVWRDDDEEPRLVQEMDAELAALLDGVMDDQKTGTRFIFRKRPDSE